MFVTCVCVVCTQNLLNRPIHIDIADGKSGGGGSGGCGLPLVLLLIMCHVLFQMILAEENVEEDLIQMIARKEIGGVAVTKTSLQMAQIVTETMADAGLWRGDSMRGWKSQGGNMWMPLSL